MLSEFTTIAELVKTISGLKDGTIQTHSATEIESELASYLNKDVVTVAKELFVEPVFLVSNNAVNSPAFVDAAKAGFKVFISYYTQAFHTLVSVERLSFKEAIRILNGRRPGLNAAIVDGDNSEELLKQGCEVSFLPIDLEQLEWNIGNESASAKYSTKVVNELETVLTAEVELNGAISIKDPVTGDKKDTKFGLTMLFRATMFSIDESGMDALFSTRTPEKRFLARWHEWRSGGIGFFNLITGNDLVEQYRNNRMKSAKNTDVNEFIEHSNLKSLTGSGPMNTTLIFTAQDVKRLEAAFKGSIDKLKTRERIFNPASAISLISLDDEWERAEIYVKGIKGKSVTTYKALGGKKSGGTDMTEIFKALLLGNKPVF